MNPQDMTPDELRALADSMDSRDSSPRPVDDHHRQVTVDGITINIDTRVLSDIRTVRLIAAAQDGGDEATFQALELFDRILGNQRETVEESLADADGYINAESYLEFCGRVFEAVGGKN